RELLEGLIPYSQRHYTRIDEFEISTFLMDYILNGMLIIEPVMGAIDDPKNESLVDPIEVVVEWAKMTADLAATSILLKDDNSYYKKLLKLQYGFEGKECLEKCLIHNKLLPQNSSNAIYFPVVAKVKLAVVLPKFLVYALNGCVASGA
ncbi:transducin beta-like protein 3, partial [Tanacetum coccineum]